MLCSLFFVFPATYGAFLLSLTWPTPVLPSRTQDLSVTARLNLEGCMLPSMPHIKEKDPKHASPQSSSITHLFPMVGSPIPLGLALPCDLSGWCRWRAVALSALFFALREVCQTLGVEARLSNLLVRDLGPGWLKQWECPCRIFLWAWKSCCQREGNGLYTEVSQKLHSNHPQNLYSVNLRHGFHCYLYLTNLRCRVSVCFLPAWSKGRNYNRWVVFCLGANMGVLFNRLDQSSDFMKDFMYACFSKKPSAKLNLIFLQVWGYSSPCSGLHNLFIIIRHLFGFGA